MNEHAKCLKLSNHIGRKTFDLYGCKFKISYKRHALKGQKLLAQGNALGIMAIGKAPCKGKSFKNSRQLIKLLPLQGDKFANIITQGVALG